MTLTLKKKTPQKEKKRKIYTSETKLYSGNRKKKKWIEII